jgi:NAD(P)-dependent dehydrogenase (short-subunit alcohol dehydrogenase family)
MKLSATCFVVLASSFLLVDGLVPFVGVKKVKVAKAIGRKAFLAGAAAGAVAVGTAGAAVAVNSNLINNNKSAPYEPAPGSMDGKVVLITGGSTGLGLESAKRLAAAGASIILTSRTLKKGEQAVTDVQKYLSQKGVTNDKVMNLVLDLDDLDSVRAFPESFSKLGLSKIDVLMNNAGVMAIPDRQTTKDGYERTFQSNHLGHFVLTSEMFPYLNRDKATIINVSSSAYQFASKTSGGQGLDLANLNGESKYGPWSSYGQSKLANVLFTKELQRRADEAGENWLTCVTLHPGAVQTDLGRYLIGEEKWQGMKENGLPSGLEGFLMKAAASFTKTVPEGASTQVFLASGAEGTLKKGEFYEEMKPQKLPKWATSESDALALWRKSEELANIKFDLTTSTTTPKTEETLMASEPKTPSSGGGDLNSKST